MKYIWIIVLCVMAQNLMAKPVSLEFKVKSTRFWKGEKKEDYDYIYRMYVDTYDEENGSLLRYYKKINDKPEVVNLKSISWTPQLLKATFSKTHYQGNGVTFVQNFNVTVNRETMSTQVDNYMTDHSSTALESDYDRLDYEDHVEGPAKLIKVNAQF